MSPSLNFIPRDERFFEMFNRSAANNLEAAQRLVELMDSPEDIDRKARRLTADLYDHGKVLRDDKFSWLYWSFTMFLVGMLVTAAAVVLDLTGVIKL